MDENLKDAIELAIETGDLDNAREAAILACDHWSQDVREAGADLKDAIAEARHCPKDEQGAILMDIENLLTDIQGILEEVAR